MKPPRVLAGRYRLDRLLGAGGMGLVWQARDLLHEQYGDPAADIAIKLLGEPFHQVPDAASLLFAEFALTRHLHHPHVVRCHSFEVDITQGCAFMTLELLRGLTLDHWLCEDPAGLPCNELQEVAGALLDALAHSHSRGVLHGDLKPGNVMLSEQGLKLFDFGLGRSQPGILPGVPQLSRERYNAWTPAYAAPELCTSGELSEATDVYACACLIFELASGRHPYQRLPGDQAQAARLDRALHKPARLPRGCWPVLRQALAFEPTHRAISAQELREAFSIRPGRLMRLFRG